MVQYNRLKLNSKRFGVSASVTMSEINADVSTNSSYIKVSVKVTTTGSSYNNEGSAYVKGTIYCNGQSFSFSKTTFSIGKTASKTITQTVGPVYHNSDGSCGAATESITVHLTSSTSTSVTTASIGMSTIPRYASFTRLDIFAASETMGAFTWDASNSCSAVQYSLNGGSWTDGNYPTTYIYGLAANTQYSLNIRILRADSQLWTESGTRYFTTYDYPKANSLNDFVIGNGAVVDLYNPSRRNVTLNIISKETNASIGVYSGNASGTINGEFKTTDAIKLQYDSIPNKSSANYFARVYCGDTNTTIDSYERTYSINSDDVKPVFTKYQINDSVSSVIKLTGSTYDNPIFVQGFSIPTFKISSANKATVNATYPAGSMVSYTALCGSESASANYSSSSDVIIPMATVVNSGETSVKAIDSRGVSQTVNVNAQLKAYTKPVISSATGERDDNGVGDGISISFNGIWWSQNFGASDNAISSVDYYYKRTSDSEFTKGTSSITVSTGDGTFSASSVSIKGPGEHDEWDIGYSYTIRVIVNDKLSSSQPYEFTIAAGKPGLAIYENKISLCGKYNTSDDESVQIDGVGLFKLVYPVGSIFTTFGSDNPSDLFGGTWEKIEGRFILGSSSSYTVDSDGGEASVTLDANQIPNHAHNVNITTQGGGNHNHYMGLRQDTVNKGTSYARPHDWGEGETAGYYTSYSGDHTHLVSGATDGSGGGQAHNNMPPYKVANIWKRTAL